jgi:hypothetical protein
MLMMENYLVNKNAVTRKIKVFFSFYLTTPPCLSEFFFFQTDSALFGYKVETDSFRN